MWVIEEQVDGRKLTEIINSQHENFLGRVLVSIKQQGLKEGAMAVSLIKGINFDDRGVVLVSDLIHEGLDSTLGCADLRHGALLRELFNAPTFCVDVALDPHGVEMCGALKNVVALGASFCDGPKYGGNTKAAIICIRLSEMKKFWFKYFDGVKEDTSSRSTMRSTSSRSSRPSTASPSRVPTPRPSPSSTLRSERTGFD
ncbi:hypothetical protein PRIC1_004789 [Phytophthora ramorum]